MAWMCGAAYAVGPDWATTRSLNCLHAACRDCAELLIKMVPMHVLVHFWLADITFRQVYCSD